MYLLSIKLFIFVKDILKTKLFPYFFNLNEHIVKIIDRSEYLPRILILVPFYILPCHLKLTRANLQIQTYSERGVCLTIHALYCNTKPSRQHALLLNRSHVLVISHLKQKMYHSNALVYMSYCRSDIIT